MKLAEYAAHDASGPAALVASKQVSPTDGDYFFSLNRYLFLARPMKRG